MNVSPRPIPVQPAPLACGLPNLVKAIDDTKSVRVVKVVALGSSTMEGEGGIVAFPYRLEAALRQEYRNRHNDQRRMIDVINRGIGGQEAPAELIRMDADVIAEGPHLVIWQIGTNSVWQNADDNNPPKPPPNQDETIGALRQGIDKLRKAGPIDIILMDPQYVPAMLKPDETRQATEDMVGAIAKVAVEKKVNLFGRFALMKRWHKVEGISFDTMVDPTDDKRLHDSDWTTIRLVNAFNQLIWAEYDKAQPKQPAA